MYTAFSRVLPLLGLLATIGLAAPNVALAQGAQHNESDLAFLKRMITSLQQTERQSAQLEEYIAGMSRQTTPGSMSNSNDPYGSGSRNSSGDRSSDLRRAEMRMRSNKSRAKKELEKLSEMQRSDVSLDAKDRDKIENAVSRYARVVEDMRRDIQMGRL